MINCNAFSIAGVKYRSKKEDLMRLLKCSKQDIYLEPEPTNKFDVNAIRCVHEEDGHFIGYVPAVLAKHLTPLMNAGLKFSGVALAYDPNKLDVRVGLRCHDEEFTGKTKAEERERGFA